MLLEGSVPVILGKYTCISPCDFPGGGGECPPSGSTHGVIEVFAD